MRFKGIAFFLIMLLVVGGIGGLIFVLSNFDTTEKYNITYMTQGGTLNTNYINGENKSYNTKTTYVLPNASYISKSGYIFEGWSQNLFDISVTQSQCYNVINDNNLQISENNILNCLDWTIPAYSNDTYTINYQVVTSGASVVIQFFNATNQNMGSDTLTVQGLVYDYSNNVYKIQGNANSATFVTPLNCNYLKIGFLCEDESEIKNIKFYQGTSCSNDYVTEIKANTTTGNKIYRAVWSNNKNIISFDSKGGSTVQDMELSHNQEIGTLPTTTRTGYEFKGWFTHEQGGTKILTTTVPNQSVTYYAQWEAITYTVKYDKNNGVGNNIDNTLHTYDVEQNLSKNTYTLPDYRFVGWNTKADGTGISFEDEQNVVNLTSEKNQVVTLYAVWKKINKAYLNKNWVSKISSLISVTEISSVAFSNEIPVGYENSNISVGADGESGVGSWSTALEDTLDDIVLYYKENLGKYDIVFVSDGYMYLQTDCTSLFENTAIVSINFTNCNASNMENLNGMFKDCSNLQNINFGNAFSTANVTNIAQLFAGCGSLENLDLTVFNTENVENMYGLFDGCINLQTVDMTSFDTSNVVDMSSMFNGCKNLQSINLTNFNTGKVTDMSKMFYYCSSLENLNLTSLNTSNVTDMSTMFACCTNLENLDISTFDTSKVTNMLQMFALCTNLTELTLGNNFVTNKVTKMNQMFEGLENIENLDLSSFDTSNVVDMSRMFRYLEKLKQLDLSNFDTSKVTDMQEMFANCLDLEVLDLSSFKIKSECNVADMLSMTETNLKLIKTPEEISSSITVGLPLTMYQTDTGSETTLINSANQGKTLAVRYEIKYNGNGATNKTEEIEYKFFNTDYTIAENTFEKTAHIFNGWKDGDNVDYSVGQTITQNANLTLYAQWDALEKSYLYNKWYDQLVSPVSRDNIRTISFRKSAPNNYQDLGISVGASNDTGNLVWDTNSDFGDIKIYYQQNQQNKNMYDIVFVSPVEIYLPKYSPELFKDVHMICIDFTNCNTSEVTTMRSMFDSCYYMEEIIFGDNFDTTKVENMAGMFGFCNNLTSLDLSGFNTSSVEAMQGMFTGCVCLTELNISSFDTSSVVQMNYMFQRCVRMEKFYLNNFVTTSLESMINIFEECTSLIELDISNFEINAECDVSNMLLNANALKFIKCPKVIQKTINLSVTLCNTSTGLDKSTINSADAGNTLAKQLNITYYGNGSNENLLNISQTCFYNIETQISENDFEKTGYSFVSWNTKENGDGETYTVGQNYLPYDELILYAQWSENDCIISYYVDSKDQVYTTLTKKYNESYAKPTNPTKEGYTFVGWSEEIDNSAEWLDNTEKTCTGNKSWYAVWKKVLTFYDTELQTVNEDLLYSVNFTENQNFEKQNPTLNDYDFVGYSTENNNIAVFEKGDSNTIVDLSNSLTFYAVWANLEQGQEDASDTNYLVSFNAGSGSGATNYTGIIKNKKNYTITNYYNYSLTAEPRQSEKVYGETVEFDRNSVTVPYQEATLAGYTFVGWTEDSNSTKAEWTSGDKTFDNNSTLYAVWSKEESGTDDAENGSFEVNFNAGNGNVETPTHTGVIYYKKNYTITNYYNYSLTVEPRQSEKAYGETVEFDRDSVTVPYQEATLAGYTFVGWTEDSNSTEAEWTSGDKTFDNNSTLYAVWSKEESGTDDAENGSFEVSFNAGNGNVETPTYTGAIYYKKNYTRTRYDNYNLSATPRYSNTSYEEAYQEGTETININYQEATLSGYIFDGWTTDSSSTSAEWTSGDKTFDNNSTWYAVWKKEIAVSYNANGGSGTMTNSTGFSNSNYDNSTTTKATVKIKENEYTRNGYTFVEWNDNINGSGKTYVDDDTYELDKNFVLYAQWIPILYTIVYDKNGGNGTMSNSTHTYNVSKNLTPNSFTKTDYTFIGWNTKIDGTGISYTNGQSVLNLTNINNSTIILYAQWAPTTSYLGFVLAYDEEVYFDHLYFDLEYNGKDIYGDYFRQYSITQSFELPNECNKFYKPNYAFCGWYTGKNGTGTKYDRIEKGTYGNLILYPYWVDAYIVTFDASSNGSNCVIVPINRWILVGDTGQVATKTVAKNTKLGDLPTVAFNANGTEIRYLSEEGWNASEDMIITSNKTITNIDSMYYDSNYNINLKCNVPSMLFDNKVGTYIGDESEFIPKHIIRLTNDSQDYDFVHINIESSKELSVEIEKGKSADAYAGALTFYYIENVGIVLQINDMSYMQNVYEYLVMSISIDFR